MVLQHTQKNSLNKNAASSGSQKRGNFEFPWLFALLSPRMLTEWLSAQKGFALERNEVYVTKQELQSAEHLLHLLP